MAHLSGFGLENFRVFKDYTWFDFAPITILVGPNSSGKSSLIKALLLMKDNLKEKNYSAQDEVDFAGALHNLGSPQNVLSKNSGIISFSFTVPIKSQLFTESIFRKYEYTVNEKGIVSVYQENIVLADLTPLYTRRSIGKVYLNLPLLINILIDSTSNISTGLSENESEAMITLRSSLTRFEEPEKFLEINLWDSYEVDDLPPSATTKVWSDGVEYDIPEQSGDEIAGGVAYEGKLYQLPSSPYDFFVEPTVVEMYLDISLSNNKRVSELAKAVCICLGYNQTKSKLRNDRAKPKLSWPDEFTYLPSIKGSTKRSYQTGDDYIINELVNKIRAKILPTMDKDFLTHWSQVFNLGDIQVGRIDNLNINYVEVGGRSLADVGYGYTQLTALLLATVSNEFTNKDLFFEPWGTAHFDEPSKVILLEEPESNLHPKFQSQLADLIISAKRYYSQFIIETHSEYMIRKFQYLVAKGEMKPEDVVIYYFNDPNNVPAGEKQVKKITIMEDGSLSDDFGPGFYDEAATWELELLKLKRSKNRQN